MSSKIMMRKAKRSLKKMRIYRIEQLQGQGACRTLTSVVQLQVFIGLI
jgi:hypothetical protein